VAFFNLDNRPSQLNATWKQLGIEGTHSALDLWSGMRLKGGSTISATLRAHGSALYRVD
jgi:hypothetical protein